MLIRITKTAPALAVLVGFLAASAQAAIKVQAWYRLGESASLGAGNIPLDASGNGRKFINGMAAATYYVQFAAPAGALGASNVLSGASLEFGRNGITGFWGTGYATPSDNFGIEAWVKPGAGFGNSWILATGGNSGNLVLQVNNGKCAASLYNANYINSGAATLNTNEWTHLAAVVTNGVARLYVNGVAQTGSRTGVTAGNNTHLGVTSGGATGFKGLIDEARIFTFASGQFSTNDLLLVTGPAPNNLPPTLIAQPEKQTLDPGDTATFDAPCMGARPMTWRWYTGTRLLSASTNSTFMLDNVASSNAGGYFAIITNLYGSATSQVATLTVLDLLSLAPATTPNAGQQAMIDRKYGMFCHFGLNTFLNLEWSDGSYSPTNYAPSKINAEQWVQTAHNAGMRYLLCITKHHDGFCMWPSAYTSYSVRSSGNTNDVVRLVADACAKYGIKLAMYYSLWDRHEPSYAANFDPGYITYVTNQLTELLSNYGPVCELWLDGAWDKSNTAWHIPRIYDLVKRIQPDCQVSVNWTIGAPGNLDSQVQPADQQNGYPIRYAPSDFRLGDPDLPVFPDPKLFTKITAPGKSYYLPFESTITLSANNYWFFHTGDTSTKPIGTLENWWNRATAQSNLLVLNAAPTRDGVLQISNSNILAQLAYRLGLTPGQPFPANLAEGCSASASGVWQNDSKNYGAALAVDANPDSRWACGPAGTTKGSLEVDLGGLTTFSRVIINEFFSRIQSFTLDAWNGTAWQTITNGTKIGESLRLDFPRVTSSKVRLNILNATDAPSIWMFKVQSPVVGAPVLSIAATQQDIRVTWPYGVLQSASDLAGPFVDVANATSPYILNPVARSMFFRLRY